MNIANQLTFFRMLLAAVCIGLVLRHTPASLIGGLAVFLLASFTDFLDGFIARKKGMISDLGRLIDPIADKVLIIGVFLAFLQLRVVNAWMVTAIMFREFIVTGLRVYALNKQVVLEAKKLGKHKTVSQIVAIILIFLSLIFRQMFPDQFVSRLLYEFGVPVAMWYVVVLTVSSGVYYFWSNRKIIRTF
ncbi:MAG: CDP-diacylglycerol--glycerol-3-phosphate 3-phosphatidyltransferase [Candidatus Omnitrophica bacterium]|nr:CDP-diacylglycerol--glycerol-3-phosphate 3-phosphatidyltransferase [Candidatus Omnitrophota bacterium]